MINAVIRKALILMLPACLLILFTPSMANAYQSEAATGVEKVRYKDKDEYMAYFLSFKGFIKPIETTDGPYAEQQFLSRTSSIEVALGKYDYDVHPTGNSDITLKALGLTFMDSDMDMVLKAGISSYNQTTKFGTRQKINTDMNRFWIMPGYFLRPQVLVAAVIDYTEWKTYAFKNEELELGFMVKELTLTRNIDIGGSLIEYDDNGEDKTNIKLNIEMDYYFNRAISVGGLLIVNRGQAKEEELDEIGLRTQSFLNENVYLSLEVAHREYKNNSSFNGDLISLSAGMRW